MKIAFVPIDNRPVCYNLAIDIANIDKNIELYIPPREYLGDLTKIAQIDKLFSWLENLQQVDCMILALDTLTYGGLIPSRRSKDTFEVIKHRVEKLKPLLKNKKVYAFSSIMRISNNYYNEEEKEYWKNWGKNIFKYSFEKSKYKREPEHNIPQEILEDYILTRNRNFEINKLYLELQKEGLFETLIFSKDDCAEYGFNVDEAKELEKLGGKTKTGADEIPLTLLARAIEKEIKIYPKFIEPEYKHKISNYEDVSIEKSVLGQLELGGFKIAKDEYDADLILLVNNFVEKQGELVMDWSTKPFDKSLELPNKPYAIADVRYANGADNEFVKHLFRNKINENFYGYSAWNTSANSLGSLLAEIKISWQAKKFDNNAFKKLNAIRFLDDWAYQANVRSQIEKPCNIKDLMQPFEKQVEEFLNYKINNSNYSYPWNRKFEIEVTLK